MTFSNKKMLVGLLIASLLIFFSTAVFAATPTNFRDNITEGYHNQDLYVEKQNDTYFNIIPSTTTIESPDWINIYLRSSVDEPDPANNIKLKDKSGNVVWTSNTKIEWSDYSPPSGVTGNIIEVKLSRGDLIGLPVGEYRVTINDVEFFKFKKEQKKPEPILDVRLVGSDKDYGTLQSDRIYYVSDLSKVDIRINNINDLDKVYYRKAGLREVLEYNETISPEGTTITDWSNINDNYSDPPISSVDSTAWNNYFAIKSNAKEGPRKVFEGYSGSVSLKTHIVRFLAEKYGATDVASRGYYIVKDDEKSQISPVSPLEETINNSAQTRRPQLEVDITDSIAGIESKEDITVKYRRLTKDEIQNGSIPENKSQFNVPLDNPNYNIKMRRMDVIDLESATETRQNGEEIQEAVFTSYDEMGEGEYAVWVSTIDQAGNSSDNHDDGPFIFYLNIDQTAPRVNNVSFNNRVMDLASEGKVHPVGAEDLNLYFEGYGTDNLVYGIRYIEDGNETDWFLTKLNDVDYITQYINRSFLDWDATNDKFKNSQGKAKDGLYEVYIYVDEEEKIEDKDSNGEDDLVQAIQNGTRFFAPDGDIVNNYVLSEEDTERRHIERFKIRVDNTPPQYQDDSLKYYKSYPDGKTNVPEDDSQNTAAIYQGSPVFEIKFKNASEIKSDDVEIYFTNQNNDRRISGEVIDLTWDQESNIHTLKFSPVIKLTTGPYSLEVNPTDVFKNIKEKTFDQDPFKIVTTSSGQVSFSIKEGERLSINQSSALEININDTNLKPKESLRILINGSPVVATGKIVNEIVTNDENEQEIKYRNEDYLEDKEYYKKEDYQADSYDVIFPDDSKRTIIIFSRLPLPTGRNRVKVEVVDENGVLTTDSVEFMIDNYRQGFGFGRLLPESSK